MVLIVSLVVFVGNMFCLYFVDCLLNCLVFGIEIIWVFIFCLFSVVVVLMVSDILEFVVINIMLVLFV